MEDQWFLQCGMHACSMRHVAKKSAEYDEQHCYQMCDNSSLYMYFKKLGFSGFSHPVKPEIRVFFAALHVTLMYLKFKTLTFKIDGLWAT